jgi:DNA-directed RNA polymerase subunit RPC12/RpoP
MSDREYVCGECRHRFRGPEGFARDSRSLMCPACGSMDLTIAEVARPAPVVMRATQPTPAGSPWRAGKRSVG